MIGGKGEIKTTKYYLLNKIYYMTFKFTQGEMGLVYQRM